MENKGFILVAYPDWISRTSGSSDKFIYQDGKFYTVKEIELFKIHVNVYRYGSTKIAELNQFYHRQYTFKMERYETIFGQ